MINIEVPVQLDKERHFRFDLNAMEMYEDIAGEGFGVFMKELSSIGDSSDKVDLGKISFKRLKIIVFAGLKHEDEALKLQDIGKISPGELLSSDVLDALLDALLKGIGDNEPAPLAKNRAQRRAQKKK